MQPIHIVPDAYPEQAIAIVMDEMKRIARRQARQDASARRRRRRRAERRAALSSWLSRWTRRRGTIDPFAELTETGGSRHPRRPLL